MGKVALDLSNVQDGFDPIPAGQYNVSIFEVEEKTASESGNPMLALTLTVLEDPYKGRKLFCNIVLIEQSLWVLKGLLKACGWSDKKLNDPNFSFDTADLEGKAVRVAVGQREYEGQMRNDVKTNRFWPVQSELPV